MLKIKFWLTGESSMNDKILAAIILLSLAFTLYVLIRQSAKVWLLDLKLAKTYAVTLFIFFVVLVISKIIDRSVNMIYEISNWMAPTWLVAIQIPQEEYLECLLPLLIIVAITQYDNSKKLSHKLS